MSAFCRATRVGFEPTMSAAVAALRYPSATLLNLPSVRAVNMDILCTIQDSHISTLVVTRAGIEPAAHSLATLHTSYFRMERTRTVVASCSTHLSYLAPQRYKYILKKYFKFDNK